LIGTRAIMDVLATLVNEGKLGRKPETKLRRRVLAGTQ